MTTAQMPAALPGAPTRPSVLRPTFGVHPVALMERAPTGMWSVFSTNYNHATREYVEVDSLGEHPSERAAATALVKFSGGVRGVAGWQFREIYRFVKTRDGVTSTTKPMSRQRVKKLIDRAVKSVFHAARIQGIDLSADQLQQAKAHMMTHTWLYPQNGRHEWALLKEARRTATEMLWPKSIVTVCLEAP